AARAALEAAGAPAATPVDEPELIIYMPPEGGALRLAWKTRVRLALDTVLLTVIDAATGAVLTQYNEVTRANVQGSGTDLTGQKRTINVWEAGGTYYLVDTSKDMFDAAGSQPPEIAKTKGAFIVIDAHNRPPTNNPQQLESQSLTQITASSPTGPWLADGVGVSWALSAVYDFYKQRFNWTSYDNQGGTLTAVVRLGQNYQNAFMATDMKLMAFGDADAYATLDIIGHEFQHGITGSTARLVYRDQSGAINEAFSDIFGELIQDFATGATDWTSGTWAKDAGVKRSMKDPHAHTIQGVGPYPASMREYYRVDFDNGGVHINHTIISHAFYLLAEGLDQPIGKTEAGKIFFRALRYHMTQNAQFVDVRLACIAAAEEIWAADTATRDRMIAKIKEAFDQVEVFEAAATPKSPTPRKPVQGNDAIVFVAYDDWGYPYLQACENGSCQWLTQNPVRPSRPAVSGDGSLALFVNADYDLCLVPTDGNSWEECLGYGGTVASVAMSPDGTRFAFVLLDQSTLEPEDKITVLTCQADGSSCSDPQQYDLMAPVLDGGFAVDLVVQADALAFSGDGRFLFYDAYNVLALKDGSKVGAWSIYALDLATGRIFSVVPPAPGLDTGFPALARTTDHVMVFDAYDPLTDTSTVTIVDLETGKRHEVATVSGPGTPGFNGDDTLVFYTDNGTIYARALTAFTPTGDSTAQIQNAAFGVVFRRGAYTPPAAELSVAPQSVDFGETAVGSTGQKLVTLSNTGTA
ncbi:MAG TPA: M4 family peptidase, partial [Desulfobacterales bacterium]|nr:M4 family peptidase [Desulfobacterales bacterium]